MENGRMQRVNAIMAITDWTYSCKNLTVLVPYFANEVQIACYSDRVSRISHFIKLFSLLFITANFT